jgi:bifunctional UDP-N-acetylglucosamine pyrophosphorylase/glucosamine-1-phosphate N-acetyltransferase
LKYPWDILDFSDMLLDKKFEREISSTAEVAESAQIKGEVYVGADAKIHENAVVKGPAYIGEGVTVGNNALVRDSTFLEENCAVGANAEIKNTVMQPSSSIHSGFLGDTIVGRSTKIGAGTITANRTFRNDSGDRNGISSKPLAKDNTKQTGRQYMGAVIGDQCDIGVNVSIMPGVQIGSNSTVGPGTTVKNNVKTSQTVYQETKTVRKSKKR